MGEISEKALDIDRERLFLIASSVFVAIICFMMVSSFLSYLLTGLLLAFISYPLFQKIEAKTGPRIAAGAVICITIFAAILPFTILLGAVGGDAAELVSNIDTDGSQAIVKAENLIMQYTGHQIDIEERAKGLIGDVASYLPSGLSSAIGIITELSIGVSIMLFLQFYALKDGRRLVDWSRGFDFMNDERQDMLYRSTAKSVWAVVKGHVLVAIAQGLIAGIGLYVVGIPNVLFWTFMMVLLGFIPMIGSAFVWFPAAIYLGLQGNVIPAVFLVIYGLIVVGGTDNFLRPLVVDDSADIHPFFILIGLIGGVGLFGPVGIFLGPVIFGVLKNLLNMVKEK
ncbi:MAG: AI-2E family transporter [Candidatus Nanohalobium sp.]